MAEEKPIDNQHEESFEKPTEQLDRIEDTQKQIVGSLKDLTEFITRLPKRTYKDDKGKEINGPLWNLITQAKKVGAF